MFGASLNSPIVIGNSAVVLVELQNRIGIEPNVNSKPRVGCTDFLGSTAKRRPANAGDRASDQRSRYSEFSRRKILSFSAPNLIL